jgi:hypothetical protein
MLGVGRPTVSLAGTALQRAGLIRYVAAGSRSLTGAAWRRSRASVSLMSRDHVRPIRDDTCREPKARLTEGRQIRAAHHRIARAPASAFFHSASRSAYTLLALLISWTSTSDRAQCSAGARQPDRRGRCVGDRHPLELDGRRVGPMRRKIRVAADVDRIQGAECPTKPRPLRARS